MVRVEKWIEQHFLSRMSSYISSGRSPREKVLSTISKEASEDLHFANLQGFSICPKIGRERNKHEEKYYKILQAALECEGNA